VAAICLRRTREFTLPLDKKADIFLQCTAMRRKPGTLLPIEVSVLEVGLDLLGRGVEEFHGFLIAKEMKEKDGARMLTAHETLYKALSRMQEAGLLDSH
jgi:PadR family transcriptional regulator PadR